MKLSAPSPGPGQDLGLLLLPQSPGRHLPSSPVKTIVFDDGSFIEFYILTFGHFYDDQGKFVDILIPLIPI